MPYIGRTPLVGAYQKCDALNASATADYTLQVSSTNVVPESVNHMIVSLNGVIQSPTTAYTVSGATLSFASALTSNDTIDFVLLLGNVLDIGTPSDATVTNAKLAQDIISGETELAVAPADTDEFLVSDAGTLKRIDYSLIKGGITVADCWRLTAIVSSDGDITSNLEQNDTGIQGTLGSAMTESSGIFTFPSTGIWQVTIYASYTGLSENLMSIECHGTDDDSSYVVLTKSQDGQRNTTLTHAASSVSTILDITSTSTHKVKFVAESIGASSYINGDGDKNVTCFTFIRLGDT